ncbi:aromatic-ring-hydroxylating dioxygenase subunit beta [Reyranella sp.]|jgi:3-phenylpropionate/cinnamic acid dioxygenase small subunit|uniref:aromatic-ring-hydroxylating dioxygenase subunit beta n=1 Tax=Reyranella sp. TaxID=1929291 RepID=UPI002F9588F0
MIGLSAEERAEIEAFVFREARLADEADYAGWEALLTDDMHYWVPFGPAGYEAGARMSYINDNRTRLATRLRQLMTGHRHAQTPPSPMRRIISNLELLERTEREYLVAGNFALYELSAQATRELRLWAGRTTWRLRRTDDGLRLCRKVVELVNASEPQWSLAFII